MIHGSREMFRFYYVTFSDAFLLKTILKGTEYRENGGANQQSLH